MSKFVCRFLKTQRILPIVETYEQRQLLTRKLPQTELVLHHKPKSRAFYTGNPVLFDFLTEIQDELGGPEAADQLIPFLRRYFPRFDEISSQIKDSGTLERELHIRLNPKNYETLVAHLTALHIQFTHNELKDPVMPVSRVLAKFMKPPPKESADPLRHVRPLDEKGVAFARAEKKMSKAHMYVLKGTGQFFVNGIEIADYFPHRIYTEHAILPLQLTKMYDHFNVWALTHCGGVASQSHAISNALARCILSFYPDYHPIMQIHGLIETDIRKKERHKPGRNGPRARWAWVKR